MMLRKTQAPKARRRWQDEYDSDQDNGAASSTPDSQSKQAFEALQAELQERDRLEQEYRAKEAADAERDRIAQVERDRLLKASRPRVYLDIACESLKAHYLHRNATPIGRMVFELFSGMPDPTGGTAVVGTC
jgi:cell division protein FtsL